MAARTTRGPGVKLRWDARRRDHVFVWDAGVERRDALLLSEAVFHARLYGGRTLAQELAAAGFDLTTLRVTVRKQP